MASTTVAKADRAAVPALVTQQGPALEITAEDVALPRMYIGQHSTKAVKTRLVAPGDIFVASGPDDPDPIILWEHGSDTEGPLFHVIGLRKGKSYSEPGGELEIYDYNDPEAPAAAWITYSYMLAIPEQDVDVPFKWLLTKTGRPSAQKMNTDLKKNEGRGPCWERAFRVTSAHRDNPKGDYFVPMVTTGVTASAESIAVAADLAVQMSGSSADFNATSEEPAI